MKIRSFISLSVFFIFMGMVLTGILRFLDDMPIVATFHMTFAFSMVGIIFFHLSNNWKQLISYIKNDKKELLAAVLIFLIITLVAFCIHHFSLGTEVI